MTTSASAAVNRQWRLAAHLDGSELPAARHFALAEEPVPVAADGQALVRVLWLSLDPYMRGRMSRAKSYAPGVELGQVMVGETVGRVVESRSERFRPGDMVAGFAGWQDYAAMDAGALRRVDPTLAPVTTALGVLGMPGLTAYFSVLDQLCPAAGETMLVSVAAGAVGATAGQIARIQGARAIGIVGSAAKAEYCRALGYDAAIDYRATADLDSALAAAAPDGIDCFLDMAGGEIHQAALRRITVGARISVVGVMAQNNPQPGSRPDTPYDLRALLAARAHLRGMLVLDYTERWREGREALAGWVRDGRLRWRESVVDGLERAPEALAGLLRGDNLGKQLVRVAAA